MPSYRSQLVNKYKALGPDFATLHPDAQNALLDYDAGRIAQGQPPLTATQSLGAIQTVRTGQPATPAPDRSPLDFFQNAVSDIGDIARSAPRLPAALVHEVMQLPEAGQRIADAEQAGANPIQAIAQAPGVRLIPGAYTLANLAGGLSWIKTELSHPVMSPLDVLPGAAKLAEGIAVGAKAADVAAEAGRPARALQAVLTKTLDDNGELTRNALGQAINDVQTRTRLGQTLDAFDGQMSRDAMRSKSVVDGTIQGVNSGVIAPAYEGDQIAADVQSQLARSYPTTVSGPAIQRLEMDNWTGATPEELAYKSDYTALNARLGQEGVTIGDYGQVYNPRNPDQAELLPIQQARRVQAAQRDADHYTRMADRRAEIMSGSQRSLDDMLSDAQTVAASETLPARLKQTELQSIAYEVDSIGRDATPLQRRNIVASSFNPAPTWLTTFADVGSARQPGCGPRAVRRPVAATSGCGRQR